MKESRRWLAAFAGALGLAGFWLCQAASAGEPQARGAAKAAPKVVFVTGDEEYRSEESMPMLARLLKEHLGFRTQVCYALDQDGVINPNRLDNIEGLEAVDDADCVVMFTRFRKLPDKQLEHLVRYSESGRPMVGFRTATHAFRYDRGPHAALMNEAWPIKVFGQKWITHHGHFGDGEERLTEVTLVPEAKAHPVLRGVKPFEAYSWLYHVDGGKDHLSGNCTRLLEGKARKSGHSKEFDRYPRTNPVAWTKTAPAGTGVPERVFFTTLGHPYDFREESMRKLAMNGILWALGMEDRIPPDGADASLAGDYTPNNSGFGSKFKAGRKPEQP